MAKTIVITGVGRGLGRSLVDEFARAGQTAIGCTRSESAILSLRQTYGSPHHFTAVDVSDDRQVQDWASAVLADYGPPDLLVNNAGAINQLATLWEIPAEEFSRVIDVNIKGIANAIRHFVPAMVARRRGIIVNFSSGWGRSTSPEVGPYCASKWAVEGLTRSLAQELPASMAAIPLNPGIIHADMLKTCFGPSAASYTPVTAWAKAAVPFLLSLSTKDNGVPMTVPV